MGGGGFRGWRNVSCPSVWILLVLVAPAPAGEGPATRRDEPDDDRTFRPTVMVRKKASQGSGTVIASVEGETLILTAAHVVEGPGPLWVELHRYNFGVEKTEPRAAWPLAVAAEVVATDPAGDLAVVRLRGHPPLPYVARLAPGDEEPTRGSVVTSVGIDGGTNLSSWRTEVGGVAWLAMHEGGGGPAVPGPEEAPPARPVGGRTLPRGRMPGRRLRRPHRDPQAESPAGPLRLQRQHPTDAPRPRPRRGDRPLRDRAGPYPSVRQAHHPIGGHAHAGEAVALKPRGGPLDPARGARRGGAPCQSRVGGPKYQGDGGGFPLLTTSGGMTLATSNPAFANQAFQGYEQVYGASPSTTMTVQGTIGKTFLLLAILSATAIWSWTSTRRATSNRSSCRPRRSAGSSWP